MRHRLILNGSSVQFDGQISGQIPGNASAQTGILAPAFRPASPERFTCAINDVGLTAGWAFLEIQPGGAVSIRQSVAMNFVSIAVIYPLN